MECPYCGQELDYHDYYGRLCAHQDGKILGEIYKCLNEDCESETFNYYFHTREFSVELHEGYPC